MDRSKKIFCMGFFHFTSFAEETNCMDEIK